MLEKVTVTNIYGQKLEMELRHPEKSGYAVTGITGIQPVDVDIKTSQFVSGKRFRYNTGFHKLRNVGINIIFYEYNNAHKRIEILRDELYEYFMTNSFVTFTFCKSGLYYSISGVVDKNQPTIFSQATGASISITCPELWFYLSDENGNYIKSEFNGDSSLLSLPISTYFPTGMKSAGSVYDELTEKKAIQRISVVDLGTLTWTLRNTNTFYASFSAKGAGSDSAIGNIICAKYATSTYGKAFAGTEDKIVGINSDGVYLCINDTAYTNAATFKIAMSGVMLAYEMATPVETDVDLSLKYLIDKFGTEQLLPENDDEPTTSPFVGKIQYGKASSVDANFTFRPSGGSANINNPKATVKSIHGNTFVWNQLCQNGNFASADGWNFVNSSGSVSGNVATVTPVSTSININRSVTYVASHKILYLVSVKSSKATDVQLGDNASVFGKVNLSANALAQVATINTSSASSNQIRIYFGRDDANLANTDTIQIKNVQVFDLTKMYGAGNEPATVAAFKALFSLNYYAHNVGSLLHFNGTGLKTVGFNQWDEEWEGGTISSVTGNNGGGSDQIRSKNYFPCFPNTTYYIQCPNTCFLRFYDVNKVYISPNAYKRQTFTTPANAHYMRFCTYQTTYSGDICINLSQPDTSKWPHNGDYLAYKEFVKDENTHKTGLSSDLIYDGNFETGFIMELSNDDGIINDEVVYIKTKVGEIETGSLSIAPKNLSDGDKLYIDTTDFSLKIYDQDNDNKIEFLEIESLSDRKPLPIIKENVNIIEVYKLNNSTNPPTKINIPYTLTYNTLYRGL